MCRKLIPLVFVVLTLGVISGAYAQCFIGPGETLTVTDTDSLVCDRLEVQGTLIVENGGQVTYNSTSEVHNNGQIIVNEGGEITGNNRFDMDAGGTIVMNGGLWRHYYTFKVPDSGGPVYITMNGGTLWVNDMETFCERNALITIGAGILRVDDTRDIRRDPQEWLDNGCLVPAAGFPEITIAPFGDNGAEVSTTPPAPTVQFESAASGGVESISPAQLTVVLENPEGGQTYTVDYAATGGTAEGAGVDYTLEAGMLTFDLGETSKMILIDIISDGLDEEDETIIVALSNPTGSQLVLGANTQHTYTILDPRPNVAFDAVASQGEEDITPVDITVSLSHTWNEVVTVDYAVTGGTATGGEVDYTLADGTLTFQINQTTPENISISLVDDGLAENDETIEVTLFSPVNAKLGTNSQHTFTIKDPVDSFRFIVMADSRSYRTAFQHVLDEITFNVGDEGVFVISAGDIDPPQDNYDDFVNEFGSDVVWYPVVGNHELDNPPDNPDIAWIRNHYYSLPYIVNSGPPGCETTTYSWDYGNAHFVALNEYYDGTSDTGTDGNIVDELYNWLVADLNANTKPVVFVTGHEPAYPEYRHVGDSLDQYPTNRDRFWKLLNDREVVAYFCGHTHYYYRKQVAGPDWDQFTWQIDAGNAGRDDGDGQTFVDVTVTDTEVQFDVWRGTTGAFAIEDSWTLSNIPTNTISLIPTGATWRFEDTGTDLGTIWRDIAYDDASWFSGPAQLGYGDGDEATVVSYGGDASNKYTTTYFRHSFDITNAAEFTSLTLELLRDDGAVVYLNGQEIARSNMPGGTIYYNTFASASTNDENTFFVFSIDPALLIDGDNVIAVEIHQHNLTSTDISFDLKLEGVVPEVSPPDGAMNVSVDADLIWPPGADAVSYDVYFGTDHDAVANADTTSPEFMGNQIETTYDPGTLEPDTTYYWAIDQRDTSGAIIVYGDVWSFTTAALPGQASNPIPADGVTDVSIEADLSWIAGSDTTSHDVYFGTTDPPLFAQNQSGTTYDPGTLAYETTYYWRIDEVGPGGVTEGTVWSFTTARCVANADIPVAGTVSGSYVDTQSSDDVYEAVTERQSGGKPSKRYSYLEHKWTFNVPSSDTVSFYVEAYKTSSSDGDDFVFAYSTDDSSYTDMVTVTETYETVQSFVLPGYMSGTVYIRVTDTDETPGNKSLDTISIDHMYIRCEGAGEPDTEPPSPSPMTWATEPYATGSGSISMTATTASDASGVEYYFACTAGGGHDSGWQDSPAYEDTGLMPESQYTYKVQARDKSAAQNTTDWSSEASATTEMQVGDVVTITKAEYKLSRSELNVEATSSEGGSAVLTVEGYDEMTYDSRKDIYKLKIGPVANPGGTVTVTSSSGGSDSMAVTYK